MLSDVKRELSSLLGVLGEAQAEAFAQEFPQRLNGDVVGIHAGFEHKLPSVRERKIAWSQGDSLRNGENGVAA